MQVNRATIIQVQLLDQLQPLPLQYVKAEQGVLGWTGGEGEEAKEGKEVSGLQSWGAPCSSS